MPGVEYWNYPIDVRTHLSIAIRLRDTFLIFHVSKILNLFEIRFSYVTCGSQKVNTFTSTIFISCLLRAPTRWEVAWEAWEAWGGALREWVFHMEWENSQSISLDGSSLSLSLFLSLYIFSLSRSHLSLPLFPHCRSIIFSAMNIPRFSSIVLSMAKLIELMETSFKMAQFSLTCMAEYVELQKICFKTGTFSLSCLAKSVVLQKICFKIFYIYIFVI